MTTKQQLLWPVEYEGQVFQMSGGFICSKYILGGFISPKIPFTINMNILGFLYV